jgi:hypothetical protein
VFASPVRPASADDPICHAARGYVLAADSVPVPAAPAGPAKKIRFTWNQTALCTSALRS